MTLELVRWMSQPVLDSREDSWSQLCPQFSSKYQIAIPVLRFRLILTFYNFFSVKDGVFRQYRGARDKDSFISFVEDKKWAQVEEISSWKDPSSVQMTMVSYFFKLSMVLRNVHTILTEEYQVRNFTHFGI